MRVAESIEVIHQKTIETVISSISNNLDGDITLECMAKIAHLSPFHFTRVFRKITGVPPKEFLSALRIEKSKELLENTNLRVTDICFDVGYVSTGTFTRRFTTAVGVSPKQYRKGEVINFKSERTNEIPLRGIKGNAVIDQPLEGKIYIGVFDSPLPRGIPLNCTILEKPGTFSIPINNNGEFYLFAVAISNSLKNHENSNILQGAFGPFQINQDSPQVTAKIKLKNPKSTDPPILMALPNVLPNHTIEKATNL